MAEEQEKKEKPKATLIKHKKPQTTQKEQKEQTDEEKKKVVVVKKKVVVVKKSGKKDSSDETAKHKPASKPASKDESSPAKRSTAEKLNTLTGSPSDKRPSPSDRVRFDSRDGQRPPRQGGYQPRDGQRPPRQGGYQQRDGQRQGGYQQRDGQRQGGYQQRDGQRPPRQGGYQPRDGQRPPRQGGYQQRDGQRPGGYQQRDGQRPGGYQQRDGQRPQRPGGFQPRGGQGGQRPQGGRPGGFQQRGGQGGGGSAAPEAASKSSSKKFFKAKKKTTYQKTKKDNIMEKDFQIKKKSVQMANPVPKEIDIMEVVTVSELAKKMNLKASELIGKLMGLGMMVTINQQIDAETAEIVASEFDCKVNIVSLYEETIVECDKGNDEDIIERPPIVTVMGHVDHGKTKLLDAIKSTDIAASEHGGITQHIGAYKVKVNDEKSVVFLDTPGHEAFTLMRARGAQITDIVVLVVAANDGVMPQTVEAINHAKEADVPIIVAVNKTDLADANPDRVKQQLSEYNLIPEDWGGSTIFTNISALKKTGIDDLLENILLQSEVLELKANPNCRAEGKIIESRMDHGRGIVSTVLIERGTLKVGDAFIAGVYPGKVRAMYNDKGNKVDSATPATPVEISGFTGMPNAGDPFQVTENEKYARQIGEKRQELEKIGAARNVKKVTLDNLYDSIQDGEIQELKAIIKGDVQGSVEALKIALEKLSTKEIRLNVIHATAGAIIENDVNLASASNAIIVGFHVRPTPKAQMLAEQEKVEIKKYNIIYDAVEDIKTSLEGMLAPELKEETIGTVEVRDTFKVPKIGVIAGCYVTSGKVIRGGIAHLYRDNVDIFNGKIYSLKRFKDDAKEVATGYECGIGLENFTDIQVGDIIEIIEIKEISKKLDG